uniref:Uncharacterized protein n=1 Tax=Plectus sambesii TaxID=2011161 RepID=A0A914UVC1_9BILA
MSVGRQLLLGCPKVHARTPAISQPLVYRVDEDGCEGLGSNRAVVARLEVGAQEKHPRQVLKLAEAAAADSCRRSGSFQSQPPLREPLPPLLAPAGIRIDGAKVSCVDHRRSLSPLPSQYRFEHELAFVLLFACRSFHLSPSI